jgi:hypothetical protein
MSKPVEVECTKNTFLIINDLLWSALSLDDSEFSPNFRNLIWNEYLIQKQSHELIWIFLPCVAVTVTFYAVLWKGFLLKLV